MKIIFKSSSNLGDVIYSIPFCKAVLREYKKENGINLDLNFWLQYNAPASYNKRYMIGEHPSGSVTMTYKGAEMLRDLLLTQHKVKDVLISDYTDTEVNTNISDYNKIENNVVIDLELFRLLNLDLGRGSITRWYEGIVPLKTHIDDYNPWLTAGIATEYRDKIVIARSNRYRSRLLYTFLNKYLESIVFVGVDEEYENLKAHLKSDSINRIPVTSFRQVASIINSCKLYIGNQTFFTSLAEGLKVPRLIEVCPMCPNVITNGVGGHMITNQSQFEELVKLYM